MRDLRRERDDMRYDSSTLFRFGDSSASVRRTIRSVALSNLEQQAIQEQLQDIESMTEFPCGESNCKLFVSSIWRPHQCITCKGKRLSNNPQLGDDSSEEENKPALSAKNAFGTWKSKYKPHCDYIREKLCQLEIVDNVMFRNVITATEGQHALVAHIVLSSNYENILSEKEKREKVRMLNSEKEKLLIEQKEISLARKELELCTKEKFLLGELRRWYEMKELETSKLNEITKRQQDLESARQGLLKFLEECSSIRAQEQNSVFRNETEKSIDSYENSRLERTKTEEPRYSRRKRAFAIEKADNEEQPKLAPKQFIAEAASFKILSADMENDEGGEFFDYPENDVFFYRENFMKEPRVYEQIETATKYMKLGKALHRLEPWHFHAHVNILTQIEGSPVIISLRRMVDETKQLIGIMRNKEKDIPFKIIPENNAANELSRKDVVAALRKKFSALLKMEKLMVIACSEKTIKRQAPMPLSATTKFICEDLLELDRILKVRNYKFAVVYVKEGQTKMDQIYANSSPSPQFIQFMGLLGDRITLKGWKGYRADFDVKNNTTGTHSYYTEWEKLEIMFHVAPMINQSCVGRLVGNDIVAIIWLEDGVWSPSTLISQVLHAQVVVKPVQIADKPLQFKVGCTVRDGVPSSRPRTPDELFQLDEDFRTWLLRKCVNLERAAWQCQNTIRTQTRSLFDHLCSTREGQLAYIVEKHIMDAKEY